VGIAFAHEGFSKVYWFQKLMAPRDAEAPEGNKKKKPDIYQDTGILFHAMTVPKDVREVEYRLIIDGLWTLDPLNPLRRLDKNTGILHSLVILPELKRDPAPDDGPAGSLSFHYRAPPGEIVTVAGDFNGWDPFMYELVETAPGQYSITIPLPRGTYHYVFYHRGQRNLDPYNHRTAYTKTGDMVSEATIP
jgi:hypothetical protein